MTTSEAEFHELIEGLRAFINAEVLPRQRALVVRSGQHRIYNQNGYFTEDVLRSIREIRQASAAAGFYAMLAPAELGGSALGYEATFRAWEAIYRICGGLNWLGYHTIGHWARGPSHVLAAATPELREDVLPDLLSGSTSMCFALSEPDAGSDIWRMRTRALRTDGGWSVSGTKQWITNAPYADHLLVFAVTDPEQLADKAGGVTAFLIGRTTPGLEIDSVIEMFGHSGGDEGIVSFTDVVVPDHAVIGEIDRGLPLAMSGISTGRIYNSARSVGLARWALDQALDYGAERVTFGRPILDNQGVSFPLANAAMEIHAARLMGIDAARRLDDGAEDRMAVAMAKAYATEMAVRVIDAAMQVHGAMGFTNELGLTDAWQQARRICVADGSAEMMRRQIAKSLRSGQRPWGTQ